MSDDRIRSHLLAHWTGRDIDIDNGVTSSDMRKKYVERLVNTLQTGLWLTPGPAEFVEGWEPNANKKRNLILPTNVSRVCFTELKPKDVSSHVKKYGHMAFVFKRGFIEKCGGGPVIYSTFRDWKVTNLDEVRKTLDSLSKEEIIKLESQQCSLTKEYLSRLKNAFDQVLVNLKNMHSPCGHDKCDLSERCLKYDFYDEFEWRVIYTHRAEKEGLLVEANKDNSRAKYYLKFGEDDLELVILPDKGTKEVAQKRVDKAVRVHALEDFLCTTGP